MKKIGSIFVAHRNRTGFDFNAADTLTILFQTTNNSSFANFITWSGKDTLKSMTVLAVAREVNNGGGRLESLKTDITKFTNYKSSNNNISEPFLEFALDSDTVNAFHTSIYCPADRGNNSVILTAKRTNRGYKILDYYLHEFAFVVLPKK